MDKGKKINGWQAERECLWPTFLHFPYSLSSLFFGGWVGGWESCLLNV